jgi:hypothetical protein
MERRGIRRLLADIAAGKARDEMLAARRKGRWIGGKLILGYNVENTKLVVGGTRAKYLVGEAVVDDRDHP